MTVDLHRDRPAPPPLEAPYPPCSLCGVEVCSDGELLYCEHCDASWHMDHAFDGEGEWHEPDAKRCTSTYTVADTTQRCFLHRGHSHAHRAPTRSYVWRWLD